MLRSDRYPSAASSHEFVAHLDAFMPRRWFFGFEVSVEASVEADASRGVELEFTRCFWFCFP